jgi:hypothetical protein
MMKRIFLIGISEPNCFSNVPGTDKMLTFKNEKCFSCKQR